MLLLLLFLLGTFIGSFLNVCTYRIPRGESILYPPSSCSTCDIRLKWYNLMPIISYIIQRGSCGYCKEEISPQYPLIEVLNGLLYILLYFKFGLSIDLVFYLFIMSILIIIFFIDLKHQVIPDSLNFLILFLSLFYKFIQYIFYNIEPKILNSLLGLIISSGLFLLIIVLSKGGMGGGDMKLIGALGFLLGLEEILTTIFLSFILGGIISSFLLVFKIKDRRDPIPFGPFISIAFLITLLWENI